VVERASFANQNVLEFYKSLPFNYRDSVEEHLAALRNNNPVESYPVLIPLLSPRVSVLEVGCGTGWLSNSVAYNYKSQVTGIDFNPVAIERAAEVARAASLQTIFRVEDLFLFEPRSAFDVVISIGVLHHTDNCHAAIRRCCTDFVRPGGHVFIGLYHAYGRRPFLDHFREMRAAGATDAQIFARYRQLHSQIQDETLLRSWFRDQVLHPHETQHTMKEMLPLLEDLGMDLVSTSINRFAPLTNTSQLVEEEKGYEELARQRLEEDRYFTGFFVFLARRRGGGTPASMGRAAPTRNFDEDTKPYVRHHPVFGYEYIPSTSMELAAPGGRRYRININSAGIRSDREYAKAKAPGVFRIIVCGDSMPAGQFLSNEHRFSEILERRNPHLEVINLALEGSGTDQELLLFERVGLQYEFDLVLLLPFLQNIRRNLVDAREGRDPATLEPVLIPKPRFDLVKGELVLRNVPVPAERKAVGEQEADPSGTDADASLLAQMKKSLSSSPFAGPLKKVLYGLAGWEPFPEYRDPRSSGWVLMEAICRRFKDLAGDKPFVIAPTFYANYTRYRMARNYWARFSSLAATPGVFAVDLLPYFSRLGPEAWRAFLEPHDMHFSQYGHLILAEALETELRRLMLLPSSRQG